MIENAPQESNVPRENAPGCIPPGTVAELQPKPERYVVIRRNNRPLTVLPKSERRRLIAQVWEMRMVMRLRPHEIRERLNLPTRTEAWYFKIAKAIYSRTKESPEEADERAIEEFMASAEKRTQMLLSIYSKAGGRPFRPADPARGIPMQTEVLPDLSLQKEIIRELREEEKHRIVLGQSLGKIKRVATPLPDEIEDRPVVINVLNYHPTEINLNGKHVPADGPVQVFGSEKPETNGQNGASHDPNTDA